MLPDDLPRDEVLAALAAGQSRVIDAPGGEAFLQVFLPPLELVIVGAVHIAQALAPMATIAGYAVTIVDPRGAFADEARFDALPLIRQWPDEALRAAVIGERTAIVTLTHDPKLDDAALTAALASPAFYIGALGSKKTQVARHARLERAGFDTAAIGRVHGPVGLDIGAKSPAEIAIAILAEMTAVLHGRAP